MNLPRILIVEDERALGLALAATVRQASAVGEIAPSAAVARKLLQEGGGKYAAMVLDIGLPDENGLAFLAGLPEVLRVPTVVITAHGEIENTIGARKLQVAEFFTKPLDFAGFTEALRRILAKARAGGGEVVGRRSGPFIGAAPAMRAVFQQVAHACATSDPVLLSGETGTGKTLAATLIHRNSGRPEGRLVTLMPGMEGQGERLREALERAAGGDLVLEDLEHFGMEMQSELVRRWDAGEEGFPRILATSGTGFREAVAGGRFRSDLYYRLQVLEVKLPPLRERIEDLPALFDYFLGELEPRRRISVDGGALECLRKYPWPGNLRELRNVVSYALAVGGGAAVVDRSHLPEHLREWEKGGGGGGGEATELEREVGRWIGEKLGGAETPSYREMADELERMLIAGLLGRFGGKLARMAKAMRGNRATLRRKMLGGEGAVEEEG